jgi:hypothetical protein
MTWRPIIGADGEEYWVDDAELPTSPAAMRAGMGDARTAMVTDPMSGAPIPDVAPPTPGEVARGNAITSDPVKAFSSPAPAAAPAADPGAAAADAIVQGAGGGQPEQAGPEYLVKPGTPGGMRRTSQTTTGIDPAEKDYVKGLFSQWESGAIDLDTLTTKVGEARAGREEVKLKKETQRQAIARDNERAVAADLEKKVTESNAELQTALKKDYNPGRLWGNPWFAISAAIGGLAGELLTLRGKRDPKQQMQFWQNINGMIDADIQNQLDTNRGLVAAAREKFGANSDQLAKSVARIRYLEDVTAELDGLVMTVPDTIREDFRLQAARSSVMTKKEKADVLSQLVDRKQATDTYQAGTAPQLIALDQAKLARIGLKQDDVKAWGASKLTGGEGAVTVDQGLELRANLQRDLPALREVLKGGADPNKIVWNQMSEGAQALLQRAGIKVSSDGTADAREVRQIMSPIIMQYGKELFGVLNEGQAAMAEQAVGKTPEEQLAFVEKRFGNIDGLLRRKAASTFGQRGGAVLDIAQEGYNTIPKAKATGEEY